MLELKSHRVNSKARGCDLPRLRWALLGALACGFFALNLPLRAEGEPTQTVRVGFFPNITHAQALVAANMTREGKGWFENRLGTPAKIEWNIYNAGPSAMEAFFTKAIDLT